MTLHATSPLSSVISLLDRKHVLKCTGSVNTQVPGCNVQEVIDIYKRGDMNVAEIPGIPHQSLIMFSSSKAVA